MVTPMKSAAIRNSHRSGKLSENSVLPAFTSSAPYTAPTRLMRPPTAQKITISIEGTMPTKLGDMKPTCSANIAPPMPESPAARQKVKTLKFDTS
ncbi:hypothetical protein D3C71_584290 [compost metagenome]